MATARIDQPYRDGGWTARQVVHHVADSHMNAFVRFRLALTEDKPTIKPYNEAEWAKLADIDARSGGLGADPRRPAPALAPRCCAR